MKKKSWRATCPNVDEQLSERYHWCCSAEQKAGILTKLSTSLQRKQWMSNRNFLQVSGKIVARPKWYKTTFKRSQLVDGMREAGDEAVSG